MGQSELDDGAALPTPHENWQVLRPLGLKGVYYHPVTQIVMLGLVCFMGPGLFKALTGLGAAGQVDSAMSANANAVVYATFSVSAFFSGPICNLLGPKLSLFLGSIGFAIHTSAYLIMKIHPSTSPFVIASGAVLGICAGLLWTAQGSLMLAYPVESQKGLFIAIFWSIFNLGGIVGAAVSFGMSFRLKTNELGIESYIAFFVLSLVGVGIPLLMADPTKVVRTDGTQPNLSKLKSQCNWKSELMGLAETIRKDPYVLLLFPMFLASNWFYTWQFNDYNGALFNIRTRSLNNLLYWVSQIAWPFVVGRLLDWKGVRRRVRAFAGWCFLFLLVSLVHVWGYLYQREYTRESIPLEGSKMDFDSESYLGRAFLFILCAILNATWQITTYWLLGAMTNDLRTLAYYNGLYKSIESAGAAGVWRADAQKLPFMNIFLSTWVLFVAGLIFALPMVYWRVTDQTEPLEKPDPELDCGESDNR